MQSSGLLNFIHTFRIQKRWYCHLFVIFIFTLIGLLIQAVPAHSETNGLNPVRVDSIPWADLSLTRAEMKPFLVKPAPSKSISPVIPIVGGIIGAGVLVYVIAHNAKEEDCSFSASIDAMPSSCHQENGSISVTTNVEATYLWSNGSTTMNQAAVGEGNYTVTITRTGSTCTRVLQTTVTNVDTPITITFTTTNTDCGVSNGTASPSVSPPGSYTYTWSNGSTGQIQQNLSPGTHSLTVSATGTCQEVSSVTINESPASFDVVLNALPANCGSANGSIEASVNPPGAYFFEWSNGASNNILSEVSPGAYSVTVTQQGTTCQVIQQAIVSELPPLFNITAISTPSSCEHPTGTATATIDPPGEYLYTWSDGQTGPQATGLPAGNFTVTVTLAGTACIKTSDVIVNELPPAFILTVASTPSSCGTGTGTATVTVDPPAEYIYQWSNGQSGPQAVSLVPGNYSVSVSVPGTNCLVTGNIMVEQVPASFIATVQNTPSDCGLSNGTATVSVDPPGTYSYLWSNQQTGPVLQNVLPGTYTVVVTDANACTKQIETTITQNPAAFLDITNVTPANCTGGGEIQVTISTNGAGPIELEIIAPGGTSTQVLLPGQYNLSSFLNILPGTYTLTAHDQSIGAACVETETTIITDITPSLQVLDDMFLTPAEQSVSGNMLQNDSGLNLQVTTTSNPTSGMVTFLPTGEFVFTPANGFSGIASFTYIVTDACGNTSTGEVTISVEQIPCNFTILTTTIPAHCGLSDGYINVEVNEPGTYSYTWDNGETGAELLDVAAGNYLVTIEDVSSGCELEFEIELAEIPPLYIDDLEITQPTCSQPGEIQFTASIPGPPIDFTMTVEHPNGTDVFFVDPGNIDLSDYINITPGNYTIELYVGNPITGCTDEINVAINQPLSIVLEVNNVFPPSSPSASDGRAIITAVVPGTLPYQVFLNGFPYFIANNNTFQIDGLAVGSYNAQVMDQAGCLSNIVNFEIPFPDIIFFIGASYRPLYFDESDSEHAHPTTEGYSGIIAQADYSVGFTRQSFYFFYSPPTSYHKLSHPGWMEFEQGIQLFEKKIRNTNFKFVGGPGIRFVQGQGITFPPVYLAFRAHSSVHIGKVVLVEGSLRWRVSDRVEKPELMVLFKFPFLSVP